MSTFAYTSGTAVLDRILTEEANRFSPEIRRKTLYRSPWVDLPRRGTFPAGMGYQLNKVIYSRALPKFESTPGSGTFDSTGVKFVSMNSTALAADNTNITSGTIAGSHSDVRGHAYNGSRVDFGLELKQASPEAGIVYSPFFDLRNMYFHTDVANQIEQIIGALADVTHWTWEQRFRTEYHKKTKNLVVCRASSTAIATSYTNTSAATVAWEGSTVTDLDADTASQVPNARFSNAILDKIGARLRRSGRSENPWGMKDGVEVHALVASPDLHYSLKTEPGYRDDYRYSEFANDLLLPFGVNQTHRGWAFIADDTVPRYNTSGSNPNTVYVEVPAETFDTDTKSVIPNPAYDTARYEAAFVLHKDVAEFLFLDPNINAGNGVTFDPQQYSGEFMWRNIPDQETNPLGTNGRFIGVLASGTQGYRTDLGYVILFDRQSASYAE